MEEEWQGGKHCFLIKSSASCRFLASTLKMGEIYCSEMWGFFPNYKVLQPISAFVMFLTSSFGFSLLSSIVFHDLLFSVPILEGIIAVFSSKLLFYLCNVLNLLKFVCIINFLLTFFLLCVIKYLLFSQQIQNILTDYHNL